MSFEEIQIHERGADEVDDVPNGASSLKNVRSSSLAGAFFGAPPPVVAPSSSSPTLNTDVESSLGTSSSSLSSLARRVDFRSIVERTSSNEERNKKLKLAKDRQSTQDIFTTTEVLSKPFNFVSGMVSTKRKNPLKKRSGILNVLSSKGNKKRIVHKDGTFNMDFNTHGKSHRLFKDILVSAMQLGWAAMFGLFACAFFGSWLLFAVVWYLTALQHGDFDEVNLKNESFVKCVDAIEDFTSCFLFSIETQHTIGYGGRATTEQCAFAIIVMGLQSVFGVVLQAFLTGIIFARFTLPAKRAQAVVFSRNALITVRNGVLNLLVQITDLRKSPLIDCRVRMVLVMKSETQEGEVIPFDRTELECSSELENANDRLFLSWPCVISHKIDEDSPLYEMGPKQMLNSDFEIVVALEGTTEETGNGIQVRTSYLPNEILWGHRFEHESMMYNHDRHTYSILHNSMNKTAVDDTPKMSAKQLQEQTESSS